MTTTQATPVTRVRNDGLLRFALKLDGVASGGLGVMALLFDLPLGLPRGLVLGLGVFLLAYGVGVFALGTRPVRALTAFAGWFPVTGPGVFLIVAQAIAVMGFITLQVLGLRRSA